MQSIEIRATGAELAPYTPDADLHRLIVGWLLSVKSRNTRAAYANDLGLRLKRGSDYELEPRPDGVGWLPFLAAIDIDPIYATRVHVDAWDEFQTVGSDTIRPVGATTRARRLAALSSLYEYLLDLDEIGKNPVAHVARPDIDPDYSPTFAPDKEQARAVWREAQSYGARATVLVGLALFSGLRVTEIVRSEIEQLGAENGHRTLTIIGKGGRTEKVALPPPVVEAIERLLAERAAAANVEPAELAGLIVLTPEGGPLRRQGAADIIARVGGKAKLPKRLTPHGLRHAYVTLALDAGVPLRDVQDGARHKDPRTTRRYDRARRKLDRSPGYAVAAFLSDGAE